MFTISQFARIERDCILRHFAAFRLSRRQRDVMSMISARLMCRRRSCLGNPPAFYDAFGLGIWSGADAGS